MVSYFALKDFGEKLRRSSHKHLALADLTSMLRQGMNVHTDKTIRHYLVTLEESGYLKRVLVDNCPRFEIQRPEAWVKAQRKGGL